MSHRYLFLPACFALFLAVPSPASAEGGCDAPHGPAAGQVAAFASQQGQGDLGQCLFYGDYTGDGVADVFAILYTTGGGNSFTVEGHVFSNDGHGAYRQNGNTELYGIDPRDVAFSLYQVEVTMSVPQDGDPRCCPTGSERFVFAMD